ncbi:hypothetical protein V2J09_010852 [Rumex salicifolius]
MTMEVEAEETSSAVPSNVSESLKRTLMNVEKISGNFDEFLSLSDPEVLAELPPLQRAQSLLTLARLTTGLFALRLRCAGIHPQNHRIEGEMERISRYQGKLERYISSSNAPLRPMTKLNFQAATRVIQHSLPDLSNEQRQGLKEISKNESGRISYINRNLQKKRKYESPEIRYKPSVRAAAQEFLEKAALELLGDQQEGFKGPIAPILIEDSSEEDSEEEEEKETDVVDRVASTSAPIVIDLSDED